MEIDGQRWTIYPKAWEIFQDWYGDKAYRQASFVEELQAAVLDELADEIHGQAQQD